MTSVATAATPLGGPLDQLIDPVTLDYVRTANGEWEQTADSRTAVMIMLETELAASPFFPSDGTRIKALLRQGDPVTPEVILTDTFRAMAILVKAGLIVDVAGEVRDSHGEVFVDQSGRAVVQLRWRDLAAGSIVDLAFRVGA